MIDINNRNKNIDLKQTVTNYSKNSKEKKEGIKLFSLINPCINNNITENNKTSKTIGKTNLNKNKLEIITYNITNNINNLNNNYFNSESLSNTLDTNNTFRKNKQKKINNILTLKNMNIENAKKSLTNRFLGEGRDIYYLYRKQIENKYNERNVLINNEPISLKFTKYKNKPIPLTTANSLSKSKNKNNNKITPIVNNTNNIIQKNNISFSSTNANNLAKSKIYNMHSNKNLVLKHINSIKKLINQNNNNLKNNDILNFNNKLNTSYSCCNTLKRKPTTNIINKSHNKSVCSHSFKPYKKGTHKINLNFNLNINFNIDLYKNKQKKLLLNNINNKGLFTQRNPSFKVDKKINRINKMSDVYKNFGIMNIIKRNRIKNKDDYKMICNKKNNK